jgi:hypothetical protein
LGKIDLDPDRLTLSILNTLLKEEGNASHDEHNITYFAWWEEQAFAQAWLQAGFYDPKSSLNGPERPYQVKLRNSCGCLNYDISLREVRIDATDDSIFQVWGAPSQRFGNLKEHVYFGFIPLRGGKWKGEFHFVDGRLNELTLTNKRDYVLRDRRFGPIF